MDSHPQDGPSLLASSAPSDVKAACPADRRASPRITAEGAAAPDIQDRFETLPAESGTCWLGGDSDVSVVIGGGPTGRRALWIYADTFVAGYDAETQSRTFEGFAMPHSTLAIVEVGERGCCSKPSYIWRRDAEGKPVTFFEPSETQQAAGELIWPVSAIASRDGSSVLLLCQRIKGFMQVVGTTLISIRDVDKVDDPRDWDYTTFDVGTCDLTWFSAIFFADRTGDSVYLFGHARAQDGGPPSQLTPTLLARAQLGDLLEGRWAGTEYWTEGGWATEASRLKALDVPSWETTVTWNERLRLWYSFNIEPFGMDVFLWTSSSVTEGWEKTKVYTVPKPFTSAPMICYAAKAHPELAETSSDRALGDDAQVEEQVELVFSWIPNALECPDEQSTGGTLFQEGGMKWDVRGYWPRFVRVLASRQEPESVRQRTS